MMRTPGKPFDYALLDKATAADARSAAKAIRRDLESAAAGLVRAGQALLDMKGRLGHGRFGRWLADEVGISRDLATRAMKVAKTLGPNCANVDNLSASALYALASIPDGDVRQSALERAMTGEPLTVRDIEQMRPPRAKREPNIPGLAAPIATEESTLTDDRWSDLDALIVHAIELAGGAERLLDLVAERWGQPHLVRGWASKYRPQHRLQ